MHRRGAASERIAVELLEAAGFKVLEYGKKIIVDGVEVGEVDIVAVDPEGRLCAVEVKAGKIDVSGLRQCYVNAELLGARPVVICRGFADDAAEKLAEKLDIEVLCLDDLVVFDPEELEALVREAVATVLTELLLPVLEAPRIPPDKLEALKAFAESSSLDEAAEKLGVSVRDAARLLAELRRQGLIPKRLRSYREAAAAARLVLARVKLQALLESIHKELGELRELLLKL